MLDIRFIRNNIDIVKQACVNKRSNVDVDRLIQLDTQRRELRTQIDKLQQQRNTLAQSTQGKPSAEAVVAGKQLKEQLGTQQETLNVTQQEYNELLDAIPNIPSDDTPVGADETGNKVIRQHGEKPVFDFTPKEHWQIGEELDVLDNARASKVAGSRFTYMKGGVALLEFALIQFAIKLLTNQETLEQIAADNSLNVPTTPFIPVIPPVFIKPDVFRKMARLEPRDDRYYIPTDDVYLVGSAEHTLGAMHMDETFTEDQLPRRYVGFSTSFRREAGSYGKDTRGILRLHQFDKLEMESFTLPEHSLAEQNFIVVLQEHLMQSLGLAYQVVQICTGDMGSPAARQIDIETWLPGQQAYRETQTADLVTDYQARRLKTKVKRRDNSSAYVHMNDATVFAMGRTIIAIMENYQRQDGSIAVPTVLQPYLGFNSITRA